MYSDIYIYGAEIEDSQIIQSEWDVGINEINALNNSDSLWPTLTGTSNFGSLFLVGSAVSTPPPSETIIIIGYRRSSIPVSGGGGGMGGIPESETIQAEPTSFSVGKSLMGSLSEQQKANIRANLKRIIPNLTDAFIDKLLSQANVKAIAIIISIGSIGVTADGKAIMTLTQYNKIYGALNAIGTSEANTAITLLVTLRSNGKIIIRGR